MECVDLKTHGMENFNVKVKCLIFTPSTLLACPQMQFTSRNKLVISVSQAKMRN